MNKRQTKIVGELVALADEKTTLTARLLEIERRRAVVWGQARRAGLSTAAIAEASKVERVTVRQYERRHAEEST